VLVLELIEEVVELEEGLLVLNEDEDELAAMDELETVVLDELDMLVVLDEAMLLGGVAVVPTVEDTEGVEAGVLDELDTLGVVIEVAELEVLGTIVLEVPEERGVLEPVDKIELELRVEVEPTPEPELVDDPDNMEVGPLIATMLGLVVQVALEEPYGFVVSELDIVEPGSLRRSAELDIPGEELDTSALLDELDGVELEVLVELTRLDELLEGLDEVELEVLVELEILELLTDSPVVISAGSVELGRLDVGLDELVEVVLEVLVELDTSELLDELDGVELEVLVELEILELLTDSPAVISAGSVELGGLDVGLDELIEVDAEMSLELERLDGLLRELLEPTELDEALEVEDSLEVADTPDVLDLGVYSAALTYSLRRLLPPQVVSESAAQGLSQSSLSVEAAESFISLPQ
jgi:hypothetical protein